VSQRGSFDVQWIDRGREPQCKPNPEFPNGIDLDCSAGAKRACLATLPYPAKRCGVYAIECKVCGKTVAVTTAGRLDDPRSIKIACNVGGKEQ
jgi:hypothetical protein